MNSNIQPSNVIKVMERKVSTCINSNVSIFPFNRTKSPFLTLEIFEIYN